MRCRARATVRSRRWYMDQLEREVTMQTAPLKLYLTEDFQEAARAFAEKRQPGPFKGRRTLPLARAIQHDGYQRRSRFSRWPARR